MYTSLDGGILTDAAKWMIVHNLFSYPPEENACTYHFVNQFIHSSPCGAFVTSADIYVRILLRIFQLSFNYMLICSWTLPLVLKCIIITFNLDSSTAQMLSLLWLHIRRIHLDLSTGCMTLLYMYVKVEKISSSSVYIE